MIMKYKLCSYTHKHGSCPAYSKVCNSCHKKGHLSKCCENLINIDESKFYNSDDKYLFIGLVTSNDNLKFEENDNKWSIDLDTNGSLINFKIDSGAQVNILPLNEYC